MEALHAFVDKLIQEKGLTNLDAATSAQVKQDLLTRAEDHVNAAIIAAVPEHKLAEFEELAADADDATVQAFCKKNIPNMDEVVAGALLNFRKAYLGA